MDRVIDGHLVSAGVASRRHSVIDETVWKLLGVRDARMHQSRGHGSEHWLKFL